MCNERNHSICYTTTTYQVHTFKNKNKRKSLRNIFVYHFLFHICLFVVLIKETRAYDMAHDENAMNSKVYIRVKSKAASGVS